MKNFNELLEKLQKIDIIQTKGDWAECIPEEIWTEYLENDLDELSFGLAIDTRRWYETSITVYSFCGGLLGVRHITNMFSESQDYEDCSVKIEFIEMKELQITTYTPKN